MGHQMLHQVWSLCWDLLSRQQAGDGMKAVGCVVVAACGRRRAVFGIAAAAAAAACGDVRWREAPGVGSYMVTAGVVDAAAGGQR